MKIIKLTSEDILLNGHKQRLQGNLGVNLYSINDIKHTDQIEQKQNDIIKKYIYNYEEKKLEFTIAAYNIIKKDLQINENKLKKIK